MGITDDLKARFSASQTIVRAVTATNQLIAEGDPVPNAAEIWDRLMQNVGWTGGPITILAEPDAPIAIWNVNTPVNNKSAKIHGMEFALQHMFGESGFGVQANYTTVNGDVEFNNNSLDTQFALVGLSDTANLVGFYENNGWQARVAYNWRDKFLDQNVENRFINETTVLTQANTQCAHWIIAGSQDRVQQ